MFSLWDEEKAREIHMQARAQEARKKGFEEGYERGQQIGFNLGIYINNLRRSEALLEARTMTPEEIPIFFPELTVEDIEQLKKKFSCKTE